MTDRKTLRSELRNLQELMHSRPYEDWTRRHERVDESSRLLANIGTHNPRHFDDRRDLLRRVSH